MIAEANVGESSEALREFFGNQGLFLVRLVVQVRKALATQKVKVTGETVAQYLQQHVKWGHVPGPDIRHLLVCLFVPNLLSCPPCNGHRVIRDLVFLCSFVDVWFQGEAAAER